jgi:nucleoside-diphosphate-sugar epimerase
MAEKRVLVTGSSGFIGRWLVKRLQESGCKVEKFDMEDGDVVTAKFDIDADHVFHLAGSTFVPKSWEDPGMFYRTNVMGTLNILEYCRKTKISLTHISAYVFGKPQYLPIDEKHPLIPANPYTHSKILAESLCSFYAENYSCPVTVLRPFNAYGPGQNPLFLIPKIVSQVLDDSVQQVEIMDLTPRRDFIFIDDLVDAIVLTMEYKKPYSVFNVGSGYSVSVRELIDITMKMSGKQKPVACSHQQRENEIPDTVADITLIKKTLQWTPKTSLEHGLSKIINSWQNGL